MKQHTDYYDIDSYFTEEQLLIRNATRAWVHRDIKPTIEYYTQTASTSKDWSKQLAAIGGYGLIIPTEYGGFGMDYLSYGLMMQELERGDTAIRVMSSIQTSLVMYSIWQFGSEEQKQKYLPLLASGELLGSFGLTEPNFGSNASDMHCNFKIVEDKIIINGSKLWIGNASHADIAIVWAKNEQNKVQGIIVETANISNFTTAKIENKWSFRASNTGELTFDNSALDKGQLLEKSASIKDAYSCLNIGRYAVAWGSLGIALDCYETALQYANERIQFGKPIASYQLIQKKLAEMITEITKAQLLSYQLAVLMDAQKATHAQISMAKRNNVAMAQEVAKEARQILGGMGITGEYPIMRHLMNLETLITYQGTHEMHLLITGKDITGINAI
ncbi:Acyl-CoA dehydrogenase, C-terminal domain family protein [Polaribacter irgensii 23-P]|uniref:glutaryl-CoA dehydrogenase (ETF) n=1 Tax=Polaribacter irgensii 23-P TaxID=313594 RepID=A4C0J0_9FLAO|nr:acyl-CoA dehydrogenase family protein [Polaribacter irgensii]EAR12933.1 Acyl-CoA dehydrogenase, C-terminal domain family protein [Polaribacter irgensii 23-P]